MQIIIARFDLFLSKIHSYVFFLNLIKENCISVFSSNRINLTIIIHFHVWCTWYLQLAWLMKQVIPTANDTLEKILLMWILYLKKKTKKYVSIKNALLILNSMRIPIYTFFLIYSNLNCFNSKNSNTVVEIIETNYRKNCMNKICSQMIDYTIINKFLSLIKRFST